MFKKAIIVGVSILSLAFMGTAFAGGTGAEFMVLKGGSMGDVSFPHKLHQEKLKDCDDCHKLFPMEAGAIQKAMASGKLKKKAVMATCKTCHKLTKAKGHTAGPTACKDCHDK